MWKDIKTIKPCDDKKQLLCAWTPSKDIHQCSYEVLILWPDGVWTDTVENEVLPGEMPDLCIEIETITETEHLLRGNDIYLITAEAARAMVKFPTWPTDPLHALAVLGEEYGELTKAMLQQTYEPHKTTLEEVRTEAIQTAAMAMRLVMSLDRYQYRHSEQHNQNSKGDAA
jgi:NTP pyrophosphatase (non-canonical NTP hydrolase)